MSENRARDERLHLLLSAMLEGRLDAAGAAELGDLLQRRSGRPHAIHPAGRHPRQAARPISAPSGIGGREHVGWKCAGRVAER